jgi:hypothetical protein
MVAPGAGRTAGAHAGDVYLEDGVKTGSGVPGENTCQAGRKGRPDDHGKSTLPGLGIKCEQPSDLLRVVGHRDDVDPLFEGDLGQSSMTTRGGEKQDMSAVQDVTAEGVARTGGGDNPSRGGQRLRQPLEPTCVVVDDGEPIEAVG